MNKTSQVVVVFSAVFFGLAAIPNQGPELRSVMREKLGHAQKILEGRFRCHSDAVGRTNG